MVRWHWTFLVISGAAALMAWGCGKAACEAPVGTGVKEWREALPQLTIDTFSYGVVMEALEAPVKRRVITGPTAWLSLTRKGKVYFSYASEPHTGSGGQTISKEWEIGPTEAGSLLDGMVADGLLELESAMVSHGHHITISSGRWQQTITAASMPPRIIERLRPYLEKGMEGLIRLGPGAKAQKSDVSGQVRGLLPDNRTIDRLQFDFSVAALESPDTKFPFLGPAGIVWVTREGKVRFTWIIRGNAGAVVDRIKMEWEISPQEASCVLDGLVADGLFDLPNLGGGHGCGIEIWYGRWHQTIAPARMPERMLARLKPYLEKGRKEAEGRGQKSEIRKSVDGK